MRRGQVVGRGRREAQIEVMVRHRSAGGAGDDFVAFRIGNDRVTGALDQHMAGIVDGKSKQIATERLMDRVDPEDAEDGGQNVELAGALMANLAVTTENLWSIEQQRDLFAHEINAGKNGRDTKAVIADKNEQRVVKPSATVGRVHELADGPVGVVDAIDALVL